MTIGLHDHVTARADMPEAGVAAGAEGVVIEVYADGSFDVEFAPDADQNLVIVALTEAQVLPASQPRRMAA